jgi:hypothetical protein
MQGRNVSNSPCVHLLAFAFLTALMTGGIRGFDRLVLNRIILSAD